MAIVFLIVGALVMAIQSLVAGRTFRRGASAKALRLYRDPNRSAFVRNFALLQEPTGWALLSAVVVDVAVVVLTDHAGSAGRVALFGIVTGLTIFAACGAFALTFRPPRRLVPQWLQEADRASGWVAPRPKIGDLLNLALFGVLAIGSLVLLALSLEFALTSTT